MGVEFEESTPEHVQYVIDGLREFDVCEMAIFAKSKTPTEVIMDAYHRSDFCRTVLLDGVPMAIFGCVVYSHLTSHAVPFFFATQESEKYPMTFARSSRRAMIYFDKYNLANFTLARNKTAVEWLVRNLGFKNDGEMNVNNAEVRVFRRDRCVTP